jgi:hypothetical protein
MHQVVQQTAYAVGDVARDAATELFVDAAGVCSLSLSC